MSCCGKLICSGCIHAVARTRKTDIPLCPFCRTPAPESDGEINKRMQKRVEVNDATAIYTLGFYYSQGKHGLPQDWAKANDLYCKSGELGCARAYHCLGRSYADGRGFEMDKKKAKYYWEIAAMNGDAQARIELGGIEFEQGNYDRAYKHYMIAARGGFDMSLKKVGEGYKDGYVTKDEYANTLRAYQCSVDEMKSKQRDIAAAQR